VARPALRLTVEPTTALDAVSVGVASHSRAASADIVLVPPLAQADPQHGGRSLAVATLGIATRYLVSVAGRAASDGWSREELLALVSELERRTMQWVAASTVAPLCPSPRRWASIAGSGRAALLVAGQWRPSVCAAGDGERLVRGAGGRNAVCLVAGSGTQSPRWVGDAVARWRAAGVRAGVHQGSAAALGARWALEVVAAPRVPPARLPSLREQLAAAPRCGWCNLPVLGASCRRCLPEWAS
jgi:hypothetical protein